ncbi:MAG TPA: hypothetical protein PLZ15_05790 [Melioribacteraceae bacterium]|nr:hypothetical protein [Melioribacteraceae bacterium]
MTDINSRKVILIIIFFLLGIFSLTLFAQDKKDETATKLDQLKGKVEKLTVKVDGKDVVFEGKEAEGLVKKLRAFGKMPEMIWLSDEEEIEHTGGKVMMFKYDSKDKDFNWSGKDDMDKKIEVRIVDGDKKVTVTTKKDGKEEIKTYEGEEAEKFLEENQKSGNFRIMIGKDKKAGDHMIYFDRKSGKEGGCCIRMKRPGHVTQGKVKKIIIDKVEKEEKEEKKSDK